MTATASHILSAGELVQLRAEHPGTRLLDVRTPGEFESEHIEGAYNVPLDTLGEHGAEIRAAVAGPVVLVCRSGQRARRAEEALKAAGMGNLYVLDGGMNAWTAAAQPVRRGVQRMSLERQVRIAAGTLAAAGGFLALFVNPLFAALPAFVGSGLVFAGITDTCAMGMLLARLPYNRPAGCDVPAMVRALSEGVAPASSRATTFHSRAVAMSNSTTCCAIALLALTAACGPQAPAAQPLDTAAIRASIDTLAEKVMRSHDTGDVELYASTWAVDGIMTMPGSPPIHGRDSIVATFRQRPPLPPGAKMTVHPTEVQVLGPEWAYVMGVDTLTHAAVDGATPPPSTFTFLVLLRKTPEGWQTYREVLTAN